MATHQNQFFIDSATTKVNLNKRLEDSGWGVLSVADRYPFATAE